MTTYETAKSSGNPFSKLIILGLVLFAISLLLFAGKQSVNTNRGVERRFEKCINDGRVLGWFVTPNKQIHRFCKIGNRFIIQILKQDAYAKFGWTSVGYKTLSSLAYYFGYKFFPRETYNGAIEFKWIFEAIIK